MGSDFQVKEELYLWGVSPEFRFDVFAGPVSAFHLPQKLTISVCLANNGICLRMVVVFLVTVVTVVTVVVVKKPIWVLHSHQQLLPYQKSTSHDSTAGQHHKHLLSIKSVHFNY